MYVMVGSEPVPEVTVCAAWVQPAVVTAGNVAEAGPLPVSVTDAAIRNDPATVDRK